MVFSKIELLLLLITETNLHTFVDTPVSCNVGRTSYIVTYRFMAISCIFQYRLQHLITHIQVNFRLDIFIL